MKNNLNNKQNRTYNVFLNSTAGVAGYFVSMLANFAFRTIFIYFLSIEYLGVNALMTNILSLLSLTEMGISSAMTFSLYEPLANNNREKINVLLKYYKKMYLCISVIILCLGLLMTPFLNFFVESKPNIPESLEFIFVLYLMNTAFSYLIIHKHSILIADQKSYIVTLWTNVFLILRYIFQIGALFLFEKFIPTLIIQLLLTFLGNFYITKIAEKRYPFIKEEVIGELSNKDKADLTSKIKSMLLYRIGSYLVNSTDAIIISKFVGITAVGMYSNYTMLFTLSTSLINYISFALTPSIGNQVHDQKIENVYSVFKVLFFIFFVIATITTIGFVVLINPFIHLWIGEKYLLADITVVFLVLNYYFLIMRRVIVSYRNALGLYEDTKFKPILEALVNLVASLILQHYMGVTGVVIGTTVSILTVSIWIEPYILYKKYFKIPFYKYIYNLFGYTVFTIFISIVLITIRNLFYSNTIINFILMAIFSILFTLIMIVLIFRKVPEFQDAYKRVMLLINR
ncbi:lipopolysaccharide biosynthesis protein [Facklamia lactis]|uniref:lipopolysaccharide biosynthesis protein n=1 Tax=Facklamia lactis TaxID=2749967 RepID=UPI0018CEF009|nr:oligosaccharide flippase family protein [Facklamia lactis]MBG9979951.1 oligosaccharide flippase family protein [Facklamia lactis]